MDFGALVKLGWSLLAKLEERNIPITAMFWNFLPDEKVWRLVIASPLVDKEGIRPIAGRIREILQGEEFRRAGLTLSDLSLVSPNMLLIDQMRRRYGVVRAEQNQRVPRLFLSEDEEYVYRML